MKRLLMVVCSPWTTTRPCPSSTVSRSAAGSASLATATSTRARMPVTRQPLPIWRPGFHPGRSSWASPTLPRACRR